MKQLLAALRQGEPLPPWVKLGSEVYSVLHELWERSERTGREHATVLAEDAEGHLHIGEIVSGTEEGMRLTLPQGATGEIHTHVYEGGVVGYAHDIQDIAALVNSGLLVSIAVSGEHVFMVVCTNRTVERLEVNEGLIEEFWNRRSDHVQYELMEDQDALWATVLEFCDRYGLAAYRGKIGEPLKLAFGGE